LIAIERRWIRGWLIKALRMGQKLMEQITTRSIKSVADQRIAALLAGDQEQQIAI
jgi:hypothetical protein